MRHAPKTFLRLSCFHCNATLEVPFRKLRNYDAAHKYLRQHDWIFGAVPRRCGQDTSGQVDAVTSADDVIFDPLCPVHGRETVQKMIQSLVDSGAPLKDSEALKHLTGLYPDLEIPITESS